MGALSRFDKEIKVLLIGRNNNPLDDWEIPAIHRKMKLLNHLKAHKDNIARFKFKPDVIIVTFVNEHDYNSYDTYEARDMVKGFIFTGEWIKDRRREYKCRVQRKIM